MRDKVEAIKYIGVALIPIFREWCHKKRYTRMLRAQIRMELIDLIWGFDDKLEHIKSYPEKGNTRRLKREDELVIGRLEELFKNSTYLKMRS